MVAPSTGRSLTLKLAGKGLTSALAGVVATRAATARSRGRITRRLQMFRAENDRDRPLAYPPPARFVRLCPDQFPPDQHAADLVGAGADIEQLCVAHEALDRPIPGIAGAAERLDRLERYLHCVLARQQN